jgi:hypothetical protein
MPSIFKSVRSFFTRKRNSLTEEQKEKLRNARIALKKQVEQHLEYIEALAELKKKEKEESENRIKALEERLRSLRQKGGRKITRRLRRKH